MNGYLLYDCEKLFIINVSLFVKSYFIIVKSSSSSGHCKLHRSPFQGVVKVSKKIQKAKCEFSRKTFFSKKLF